MKTIKPNKFKEGDYILDKFDGRIFSWKIIGIVTAVYKDCLYYKQLKSLEEIGHKSPEFNRRISFNPNRNDLYKLNEKELFIMLL